MVFFCDMHIIETSPQCALKCDHSEYQLHWMNCCTSHIVFKFDSFHANQLVWMPVLFWQGLEKCTWYGQDHLVSLYMLTILISQGHVSKLIVFSMVPNAALTFPGIRSTWGTAFQTCLKCTSWILIWNKSFVLIAQAQIYVICTVIN